ncbi:MAG: hypothetical protein PVG35_07025 [Desulfobacterales bacterium]
MKSCNIIMRHFIPITLLFFFSISGLTSAGEDNVIEVEAEGSHQLADGYSNELAKSMALYNAKRKAVDLAGRYLARKSLIEVYELDKDEIYSLAAREITAEILEEKRQKAGKTLIYRVRIKARIRTADFVKAELENRKLVERETNESYHAEMEQVLSDRIDPGKDISKAYRLLRERKWRIALIYMNHLEKKYPNWAALYMAKALAYYVFHEPVAMKKALNTACQLGDNTACDDLKNIIKVNEYNFGISTIE